MPSPPDPTPSDDARHQPPVAVTPPVQVDPEEGAAGGPGTAPPPVHHERRKRAIGWQNTDILRAVALGFGLYLLLRLLWFSYQLFLTAFLGVLFGLAVSSGVDRLQRFRIPRGIAAAVIVVAFYGALAGFGFWMAPTIRDQALELRRRLPIAADRIEEWMSKRPGLLSVVLGKEERRDTAAAAPGGAESQDTALARAAAEGAARGSRAVPPVAAGDTTSAVERLRDRIGSQLAGLGRYLFPFLSSTVAVFAGLLLITFLAIYIAADPGLYRTGLMHLFPHTSRRRAGEVLSAMATVLRKWLVTQLIAMAVIGTVTTVVLLILDVKAAFALGLLAGLFEFIPTIGPTLSAIPAIAMGFVDSPQKALTVTVAYIGIQFLENHILIPILMKGGVDLPPALTILAQALLALMFGFLGLMVAVPILAAAMVAVKMLYVEGVVGDGVVVMNAHDDDDGG